MKKILIPVDLHDPNTEVFRFAAHLAEKEPVEITLMNVVEFPVIPGLYRGFIPGAGERARHPAGKAGNR
jgi:nucleotide-binding universal stress UspA family protein